MWIRVGVGGLLNLSLTTYIGPLCPPSRLSTSADPPIHKMWIKILFFLTPPLLLIIGLPDISPQDFPEI